MIIKIRLGLTNDELVEQILENTCLLQGCLKVRSR
jgi:hypothetical protein